MRLYIPLCQSIDWSVGRSVPLILFWRFWAFWAYCSCQDALVSFSSTAPAHPHATRVAVYPTLFMVHVFQARASLLSRFLSVPEQHVRWMLRVEKMSIGKSKFTSNKSHVSRTWSSCYARGRRYITMFLDCTFTNHVCEWHVSQTNAGWRAAEHVSNRSRCRRGSHSSV